MTDPAPRTRSIDPADQPVDRRPALVFDDVSKTFPDGTFALGPTTLRRGAAASS